VSYHSILGGANLPLLNLSGSALARPEQIQDFLFDNLSTLHARRERRRLNVLGAYQDNWDGRGSAAPDPLNIVAAKAWILEISKVVASSKPWMHPHIALSEEGEVMFEWWRGEKKITLYVSAKQILFIRSWSDNIEDGMEDGVLSRASDFSTLWNWLFA
jgi:hypothetical protein